MKKSKAIKIYSFFAGTGFLDLGFEDNGYIIQLVNEYSNSFLQAYKYARQVMNKKTPAKGYYNCDINDFLRGKLRKELNDFVDQDKKNSLVGFIGGPPCPDFSIAGKNKGISGKNGRLTTSYKRIILDNQPDFFLFENVKGLWTTQKHKEEYIKIKNAFVRKGYIVVDTLANALEYGVPQERERVLLFGVHKSVCKEEDISKIRLLFKKDFFGGKNLQYVLTDIKEKNWPTVDDYEENYQRKKPDGIIEELTVNYWFNKNDVINHVNALDYFIPRNGLEKMKTISEGDVSRKSYKRLHRWRYSPTVAYGNNEVHLHPFKSRRISVSEALALQSLPKGFIINPALSLTDKFKTIGNGVPYLMAYGVAKCLKKFLNEYSIYERHGDK